MYRKIWKDINQKKVFTFEEWTDFQGDSGFYCLDFNHYKASLMYYLGN